MDESSFLKFNSIQFSSVGQETFHKERSSPIQSKQQSNANSIARKTPSFFPMKFSSLAVAFALLATTALVDGSSHHHLQHHHSNLRRNDRVLAPKKPKDDKEAVDPVCARKKTKKDGSSFKKKKTADKIKQAKEDGKHDIYEPGEEDVYVGGIKGSLDADCNWTADDDEDYSDDEYADDDKEVEPVCARNKKKKDKASFKAKKSAKKIKSMKAKGKHDLYEPGQEDVYVGEIKGSLDKDCNWTPDDDDATPPAPTPSPDDNDDETPAPTPIPDIPIVTGDPHFVMWSGRKFDFHGGCDMVLLKSPDFNNGQGLSIHIRTKIVRWWSYVDSAVVQIGNDTIEVMGGVENKRYFVNGQPGPELHGSGMMPFTIGGHPVRYRHLNDHQFQFKIFMENDQNIVLKAVKDFMRVDVENPSKESFGESVGLMGSYDGDEMLGRDGFTVLEDPIEFGKEWQVQRTEPMLFHNVEGVQHPQECAMPTAIEEKRRLEGSISREDAELACAKVSPDSMMDCVYDVMATNDVEMAGAF